MKFKSKGRKIYKTKEKNYYGKSTAGKILSAALTLLLLGGIGFLGYSVAEPIINYSKKTGDSDSSDTESTSISKTADLNGTLSDEASAVNAVSAEEFCGASLSVSDMTDLSSLTAALRNISDSEGIEYVSVPLKISGGEIYYASQIYEAQACGSVQSELTLDEIVSAIRAEGFTPVAELSLLRDNLLPQTYPDASYKIASDGSNWLDNDSASGGKPWASPFSELTQAYLNSIAGEVAAADFDKIICCDAVFPPFKESDIELLDFDTDSEDFHTALTLVVNQLYSSTTNSGSAMFLEISAEDLIMGYDDIIQPMLLDVSTLVLDIDFDVLDSGITTDTTLYEFAGTPSENAVKAMDLVQDKLSDYNVVVRLSGDNTDEDSLLQAKDSISDLGYSSFIIG